MSIIKKFYASDLSFPLFVIEPSSMYLVKQFEQETGRFQACLLSREKDNTVTITRCDFSGARIDMAINLATREISLRNPVLSDLLDEMLDVHYHLVVKLLCAPRLEEGHDLFKMNEPNVTRKNVNSEINALFLDSVAGR